MNKQERNSFYRKMDDILPSLNTEDQMKIDFVKSFMERRFMVKDFEDSYVNIERMGTKSLMYLLFAMLVEYDDKRN